MKLTILIWIFVAVLALTGCKQPAYKVNGFAGTNINIDSTFTSDSSMNAEIAPFRKSIDAQMNRVIGISAKELLNHKPESPLSNFVSDLIQQKALVFMKDNKMDSLKLLTLMNIKGIRAPIPQGNITVRNIFEVMPFENEIVLLKLSGDSITSLFKFLGKTEGDGIAGAFAKYSDTKLLEVTIGGELVDPSENYYLATSDYLANGGDHYSMIMEPIDRYGLGLKLREAIIESIESLQKQGKKVDANIEGRIVFNELKR